MTTRTQRLHNAFTAFDARYGHHAINALQVHESESLKAAAKLQEAYDAIKDDPAKVAAQDETMFTASGLRDMAALLRQTAQESANAVEAYEKLQELYEETGE